MTRPFGQPGSADDHRHAQPAFIEVAFAGAERRVVRHARMRSLGHVEAAVVAREDDDRPVAQTGGIEVQQQAADNVVERLNRGGIARVRMRHGWRPRTPAAPRTECAGCYGRGRGRTADQQLKFLSAYADAVLGWVGGSVKVDGTGASEQAATDRLDLLRAALDVIFGGRPTFRCCWTYIGAARTG